MREWKNERERGNKGAKVITKQREFWVFSIEELVVYTLVGSKWEAIVFLDNGSQPFLVQVPVNIYFVVNCTCTNFFMSLY